MSKICLKYSQKLTHWDTVSKICTMKILDYIRFKVLKSWEGQLIASLAVGWMLALTWLCFNQIKSENVYLGYQKFFVVFKQVSLEPLPMIPFSRITDDECEPKIGSKVRETSFFHLDKNIIFEGNSEKRWIDGRELLGCFIRRPRSQNNI